MSDLVHVPMRGRITPKAKEGPPEPLADDGDPKDPSEGYITVQATFEQAQMMLHAPAFAMATLGELSEGLMNWVKENDRQVEGSQVIWKCELVAKVPQKKPTDG